MNILQRVKKLFTGSTVKENAGGAFVPDDPRYQRFFAAYLGLFYQIDRMARARGGMLVDQPLDERMVFIARGLMKYNPYATGIINALRSYTLGAKGFRIEVAGEEVYKKEITEYIDRFKEAGGNYNYDWWKQEREFYERAHVEGETFVRFFVTEDSVLLRPIEPEWVLAPDGTEQWTFGCRHEEGDVHNIIAFNECINGTNDEIPASEVYHIKSKLSVAADKRGRSDFQYSAQLLDDSFKLWKNFLQSEAVRQSIIYFSKQAEGVSGTDIEAAIAGQADYSAPNATGTGRNMIPPSQLVQGAGVEYLQNGTELAAVPSPESIQGTISGVNAALLAAGRPYHMPLWLITGDQNSNNSLDLSEHTPFGASIQDEQMWYSRHLKNILDRVLVIGVEHGHLSEVAVNKTKIAVCPEVRPSNDPNKGTDRLKILEEDGIISRRTRTTHEGFDYDEEELKGAKKGPDEGNSAV